MFEGKQRYLDDLFQSTLSMRRATKQLVAGFSEQFISIHALHEESDLFDHATLNENGIFQSTLSMRRATMPPFNISVAELFQSTLSMRRATLSNQQVMQLADIFQSTLSMRRATCRLINLDIFIALFQSTLSMRRATGIRRLKHFIPAISIHALHEESDKPLMGVVDGHNLFQSTLSMRRATEVDLRVRRADGISIHALHEESD